MKKVSILFGISALATLILLGVSPIAMMPIFLDAQMMGPGMMGGFAQTFTSNGQRIFFTGVSERSGPISFEMDMGMMGRMMGAGGTMGCAMCHGPDGRGGQMMVDVPNITYQNLTKAQEPIPGVRLGRPAYNDELLKLAITKGIGARGNKLIGMMPRWKMSERDLSDVIEYLKTLR